MIADLMPVNNSLYMILW